MKSVYLLHVTQLTLANRIIIVVIIITVILIRVRNRFLLDRRYRMLS